MIYVRSIFKQDLRDGKQIAFPKEPSNDFFNFNYTNPDPERLITFCFTAQDNESPFIRKSGEIITTRLYASKSESRIDGELKNFLRDELKAKIGDLLIITRKTENSFDFDLITQTSSLYSKYTLLLKNRNHEIVLFQEGEELPENTVQPTTLLGNLKEEFADWFIELDGVDHNYFKDSFSSNKMRLIEALAEYEKVFTEEFNYSVFELSGDIKLHLSSLETDIYKDQGKFFEFSQVKSKHMPRAILGKNNFLKFLEEKAQKFQISNFQNSCEQAGLIYSRLLVTRFISSLLTKPFVILTGLSGSGKTKLAEAFAKWISHDSSQYGIVPVGADWTNRDPLLGYPNALDSKVYIKPDSGVIDLFLRANSNPQIPYFLILDEMNLSHVERYFADFLSVMESKDCIKLYDEKVANENDVPSKIKLPENLFIVGTVNIDETTNMFSPKVLDRANTIEFRVDCNQMKEFLDATIGLDMGKLFLGDGEVGSGAILANQFTDLAKARNLSLSKIDRKKISGELLNFFTELAHVGAEFGFRSASEILLLINQIGLLDSSLSFETKIDIAIMQKLLPKLHGSRRKLSPILKTLGSFCIDSEIDVVKDVFEDPNFDFFDEDRIKGNSSKRIKYPLSLEKLARMYRGAIDNGFASYAEA